ncbi:MAG: hypothetical protein EOO11_12300, partial [Chitinophagaceae bacterium]
MKRSLRIAIGLVLSVACSLSALTASAQNLQAVTFSGSPSDFTNAGAVRYGAGDNVDYYVTYDATYVYFGAFRTNNQAWGESDHFTIYIDSDPTTNPTGAGNGMTTGVAWDGNTPNLPFRANYRIAIRRQNSGRSIYSTNNGSSWTNGGDNAQGWAQWTNDFQNGALEVRVPWSDLGNPSGIYFTLHASYNGGFFAGAPSPVSGTTLGSYFGGIGVSSAGLSPTAVINSPITGGITNSAPAAGATYGKVTMTSGSWVAAGDFNIAPGGSIVLSSGTLDVSGRTINMGSVSSGGPTYTGGATLSSGGTALTTSNSTTFNFPAGAYIGGGAISSNAQVIINKGLYLTGTSFTLNSGASLQINAGGFVNNVAPIYAAGSNLIYNSGTIYGRSKEWTSTSGSGYPANVTIQNGTTLALLGSGSADRALSGDLALGNGSSSGSLDMGSMSNPLIVGGNLIIGGPGATGGTLTLGTNIGGDIKVGGNWTRYAGNSVVANNRAVYFTGSGTNLVSGPAGSTSTFAYLISEKTGGSIRLGTDMAITAPTAGTNGLSLVSGAGLDLAGFALNLTNATASNLLVRNGAVTISGGPINIAGATKTITASGGGTLVLGSDVTLTASSGINFGAGLSTVNGILQLNSGGSVVTNAPVYGTGSSLVYNSGGSYGRSTEWSAASGAGYPWHITVQNGTTLDLGAGSTDRALAGDLTLGSGTTAGSLSSGTGTGKLVVGGNLLIGGNSAGTSTLTLTNSDLDVSGNWTRTAQGTFSNSGNRTVSFLGAGNHSFSAAGGGAIANVVLDKPGGSLTLLSDLNVGGSLALTDGSLATGTNTLSIGGSLTRGAGSIAAAGGTVAFTGTAAQAVPAGSFDGAIGTLVINNAGGVTLSEDVATGDLALTSGALAIGTNALRISGNVTRTSGSVDASAATVVFNGSTAQTVAPGAFGPAFENLELDNPTGLSLSGPVTVTGILRLLEGPLSVSGTLTVADAALINRGNGSLTAAPSFAGLIGLAYTGTTNISSGFELPAGNIVQSILMNAPGAVVTLDKPVDLPVSLALLNGVLDIAGNNLSVNAGFIAGGSAASYVRTSGAGVLVIKDVVSETFPVGNASFNPVTVASGLLQDWRVRVEDAVTGVQAPYNTNKAVSRQWHITPDSAMPVPVPYAATLTFYYDGQSDAPGLFDENGSVKVWHFLNGHWEAASAPQSPGSGFGMRSATATGVTYFSPFAIANSDAPLPVSLMTFTGKRVGTVNELKWVTASESNNRGFSVERSTDGRTFTSVGFVTSRATGGNSSSVQNYSFIDANASGRKWYYRLKQEDLDGRTKLSTVVVLSADKNGTLTVDGVYPNPAKGALSIRLQGGAV